MVITALLPSRSCCTGVDLLLTARSPRDSKGELIPPSDILEHADIQCEHLSPPRVFTDPDAPDQVYAVCAALRTVACDYLSM